MSYQSQQQGWNIERFRNQVNTALIHVKRILENNKNPTFPSETQHQYEDKFILVDMLSRLAVSSTINSLLGLGMSESQLKELLEFSKSNSVSLRFKSTEKCSFLRETKRDVDSSTKHVVEGFGAKIVSKTVTTITEYFWKFEVEYELEGFRGTGSENEDVISILKRCRNTTVMTTTDHSPRPEIVVQPFIDLNISHFLHLLSLNENIGNENNGGNNNIEVNFSINRRVSSCHTPRRNNDVDKLLDFFRDLYGWCGRLRMYLSNSVFTMEKDHGLDLSSIYRLDGVFIPVVPLMNQNQSEEDEGNNNGFRKKRIREIDNNDPPMRIFNEEDNFETKSNNENNNINNNNNNEEENQNQNNQSTRNPRVRRQGSHDLTTTSSLPSTGLQRPTNITNITNITNKPEIVLGIVEAHSFLEEEKRSLIEKYNKLRTSFPSDSSTSTLITTGEAILLTTICHIQEVCQHYKDGVDYVEDMLRNQLISAIGKVVKPNDFNNYMKFHNRKIFLPNYQPKVFCYGIRRSQDHTPEGTISIEEYPYDGSISEPISTLVHSSIIPPSSSLSSSSSNSRLNSNSGIMTFTVNSASTISFGGERHLHTYLFHKFENDSIASEIKLRVEARQFSSFIVLIGRITSCSTFDAKYGMIVQNKDDITIPLELETIPSAKEFKDAISSLSPEQQRFAKAFRSMQLESTLFGVCVIQIKPQLEKVLNLPPDSLTKEIRLTQDLMELFITYQIPSDLVSYDGEDNCSIGEKINRVKYHVKSIQDMINDSKEREIEERKQEERYKQPIPAPMAFGGFSQQTTFSGFGSSPSFGAVGEVSAGSPRLSTMAFSGSKSALSPSNSAQFSGLQLLSSDPFSALSQPPPQQQQQPSQPKPSQQSEQQSNQNQNQQQSEQSNQQLDVNVNVNVVDYTKIPKILENKFEEMDKEGSVRPTIINPGKSWTKTSKKSLLSESTTKSLGIDEQKKERSAAFDLLDALTKSGGFEVNDACLHVLIAATHCFDRSLVDTVIEKNVNPIEKVEFSSLIMASTIHNEKIDNMVYGDQLNRLLEHSPSLSLLHE